MHVVSCARQLHLHLQRHHLHFPCIAPHCTSLLDTPHATGAAGPFPSWSWSLPTSPLRTISRRGPTATTASPLTSGRYPRHAQANAVHSVRRACIQCPAPSHTEFEPRIRRRFKPNWHVCSMTRKAMIRPFGKPCGRHKGCAQGCRSENSSMQPRGYRDSSTQT